MFLKAMFLVGAFAATLECYAQIPDYFDNNPEWGVTHAYPDGGCFFKEEIGYYVSGVVQIDEWKYSQIGKRLTRSPQQIPGGLPCYEKISYLHDPEFMLLRQQGRKVFAYDRATQSEMLYLDYSLEVGDTLPKSWVTDSVDNQLIVVDSIDYILVGSDYRKRLFFSPYCYQSPICMVEGIVTESQASFNENMFSQIRCAVNFTTYFKCYKQNNQVLWPNANSIGCANLFQLGIEDHKPELIQVFPNPAADNMRLSVPQENLQYIAIHSNEGRLIRQDNAPEGEYVQVSALAEGMYILSGTMKNGKVIYTNFVVAH